MAAYEAAGETDEWYTPLYVFEALGCWFDLDVAAPSGGIATCVPADRFLTSGGLTESWQGFVWMNPPFGHQSTKRRWLDKFFDHGDGIALTPDRTSAPWFREAWWRADRVLFAPKVKFYRFDGTRGDSPGTGSVLWAAGERASLVLDTAVRNGLGISCAPNRMKPISGVLKQDGSGSLLCDIERLKLWRQKRAMA